MASPPIEKQRAPRDLLLAFAILWAVLAINPKYRADWALENILVLGLAVIVLVWRRRIRLTGSSWLLLLGFLSLHEVGAHYTYSEVPYEAWVQALTGHSLQALLGWERNHYDRLVHFCAGLMLLAPIRELLCARFALTPRTSSAIAVNIVMSGSMLYELIEWAAAIVFGGDLGAAYLGTQGDPWDAHKDMLLASVGALLTAGIVWMSDRRRRGLTAQP